jgi:hypothetical protein
MDDIKAESSQSELINGVLETVYITLYKDGSITVSQHKGENRRSLTLKGLGPEEFKDLTDLGFEAYASLKESM